MSWQTHLHLQNKHINYNNLNKFIFGSLIELGWLLNYYPVNNQ